MVLERLPGNAKPAATAPWTPGAFKLNAIEKLVVGGMDGSRRSCMDPAILAALDKAQLRELVQPHDKLTNFFVGLQPQLLSRFRDSSIVLAGRGDSVKATLLDIRLSQPHWHSFLAVCREAGMDPDQQLVGGTSALQAVRELMGVLISKYVHANLQGMMRHTQLLAAQHQADAQALRDERRADAARKSRELKCRSERDTDAEVDKITCLSCTSKEVRRRRRMRMGFRMKGMHCKLLSAHGVCVEQSRSQG